jgi:hypothetical protein
MLLCLRCPATPATYQSDITLLCDLSKATVAWFRLGGSRVRILPGALAGQENHIILKPY